MRLGPPFGVDLDVWQLLERFILLELEGGLFLLRSLEHLLDELHRMLYGLNASNVDVGDMIARYLGKTFEELLNMLAMSDDEQRRRTTYRKLNVYILEGDVQVALLRRRNGVLCKARRRDEFLFLGLLGVERLLDQIGS